MLLHFLIMLILKGLPRPGGPTNLELHLLLELQLTMKSKLGDERDCKHAERIFISLIQFLITFIFVVASSSLHATCAHPAHTTYTLYAVHAPKNRKLKNYRLKTENITVFSFFTAVFFHLRPQLEVLTSSCHGHGLKNMIQSFN